MLLARSLLVGLFPMVLGGAPADPKITPADFRTWFSAASEGDLRIPEAVAQHASGYRYVFVGGFRSERMPGYFAQNARELRAQGVAKQAIHFLYPSSDETVEGNAAEVRARFLEIAREGPESLVVIGHSRGACDVLAFAVHNPGFVRDRVRALFLVQGPFGGTGVADFVAGDAPAMDRRIPWKFRVMANLAGNKERRMIERGKHGGLADMTRDRSQDYWERTLEEHAEALRVVGPKTYYITAEAPPSHLRLFKRATAHYLNTHFGANDGIVALDDQSLPELGTVLGVVDAGHSDLTNRFPASARASQPLRRALIQSIVMAVGRPDDATAVCSGSAPRSERKDDGDSAMRRDPRIARRARAGE